MNIVKKYNLIDRILIYLRITNLNNLFENQNFKCNYQITVADKLVLAFDRLDLFVVKVQPRRHLHGRKQQNRTVVFAHRFTAFLQQTNKTLKYNIFKYE